MFLEAFGRSAAGRRTEQAGRRWTASSSHRLHTQTTPSSSSERQQHQQVGRRALTVCGQVVDQQGQEGDEHAGDDDVDHVEERFASDDQVEGDVLVLVALHGNVFVGVSLGGPVDDLPLTVLCASPRTKA